VADSQAIRAGRAFVELFADDSALAKGLKRAEGRLKSWGKTVTGIGVKLAALGAAITAPLSAAVGLYTETASSLGKMSQRTGIAVEELSALAYVAARSGITMDQLELAIRKMQKALYSSGQGSKQTRQAFHDLGITAKELRDLSPDEQIAALADKFRAIDDPTKKAALAMKIFGKSGTEMIPMLERGSAGIHELANEARQLGLTMSTDDVAAAKEMKIAMSQLKASFQAIYIAIGSAIVPGMARLRALILPTVATIVQWVRENRMLFDTLFDIATGLSVGGAAVIVLGKGISLLGTALGSVLGLLKGVAAAFLFLLSPIGLVIGLLVGGVAAWLTFTDSGQAAMGDLKEGWAGIVDAVQAGDLALAAKIAWAGLKSVFIEGVQFLKTLWIEFSSDFIDNWNGTIAMMKLGWANFSTNFQKGILVLKYKLGMISQEEGAAQNEALHQQFAGRKEEIGGEFLGKKANIQKEKEDRLRAVLEEHNAARDELGRLTLEAKQKRERRQEQVVQVAQQTAQQPVAAEFGKSAGAFNAIAALRLEGGQDVYQQQLDRLEDIKGLLGDLLGEARVGGRFA